LKNCLFIVFLSLLPVCAQDNVRIGDEETFLIVEITAPKASTIKFQISPYTRVGYDAVRKRIRAELSETSNVNRKFNMWFPGKEAGSFAIDGDETKIWFSADGLEANLIRGDLIIEQLEKTLLRGSFNGTFSMNGVTYTLKARFLLPAYIR